MQLLCFFLLCFESFCSFAHFSHFAHLSPSLFESFETLLSLFLHLFLVLSIFFTHLVSHCICFVCQQTRNMDALVQGPSASTQWDYSIIHPWYQQANDLSPFNSGAGRSPIVMFSYTQYQMKQKNDTVHGGLYYRKMVIYIYIYRYTKVLVVTLEIFI